MTTNELRQKYLDFFSTRGGKLDHTAISSASLIPENDPTTLFTGSGMQPMVPYLLGEKHPQGTRITDSQKCFRAVDMDEVGDNRHTTFFEMLGNWSLGDYFKKEQIEWMFEFLTSEIGIDPSRLYITCFIGDEKNDIPKDEESAKIWQDLFATKNITAGIVDDAGENGMQGGRIFYYSAKKNWWSRTGVPENMPEGEPGGPDSEMFWDFGEHLGLHKKSEWKDEPCHPNCDCGRFVEIGNNVFMQYKKVANGFEKLAQPNVDFGGGLERMGMALLDNPDIFALDIFENAKNTIEELSGKKYGVDKKETYAYRVILDHLRAATFLIADGAIPSNKDQGYFTRRLIRRAVRFGNDLGVGELFTKHIAESYIDLYQDIYPDLLEKKALILGELKKEEEKFSKTLEKGMKEFRTIIETRINGVSVDKKLASHSVFTLYTTYGFPIELIIELAKEKGLEVDIGAFERDMKKHQELSRSGAEQKFKGGLADHGEMSTKYHTATHLLHSALRKVLGDHVAQKGSNITAERLRFDFTHPDKMTPEQIQAVEKIVNDAIEKDLPVSLEEMTVEEAKAKGAIGLFGDKYGDRVKVYTIGADDNYVSREICGGPHVEHIGNLGHFVIKKEESSSAGIRRIKAVLE